MKAIAAQRPASPSPHQRRGALRRTLRLMPSSLPETVQRGLRALSARVLHIAWTDGLLRLLAAAAILLILQAATDLLFDLPRKVRAGLLAADLGIGLFLIVRHLVLPWRGRLVPEEAAMLAERCWPQFRTSLISAVQLARQPNGSALFVEALLRQVREHARRVDLRAAAPWRRLKGLASMTLVLVLFTAALVWWTRPNSLILARRVLLSNEPLPTRTVVVAITQDLAVVPGQSVELSARAKGEIPRSARVELSYAGKAAESVPVRSRPADPAVFSLALPNVQQPLTYRFYMNDGLGLEWKVSVLHAPVIQTVKFRQNYPAYTGLPALEMLAGNLRLLAGSRLEIEGRASQALRAARIVPQGAGQPVEAQVGNDRQGFHGELPVPAKGLTGFSILLQNDQEVESRDNTVYAVELVADLPPVITIEPGQPEKTTLVASVKPGLRFNVRDDFLIKKITLLIQAADSLGEGEEPSPAKAQRVPIAIAKAAGALSFDYHWDEPGKTVKWLEGNTFHYWIEAVDNNDVTGPGVTLTPVREWGVVSVKTKHDELTDHLRQNAELIENLSNSQRELQNKVSDLLKDNHK